MQRSQEGHRFPGEAIILHSNAYSKPMKGMQLVMLVNHLREGLLLRHSIHHIAHDSVLVVDCQRKEDPGVIPGTSNKFISQVIRTWTAIGVVTNRAGVIEQQRKHCECCNALKGVFHCCRRVDAESPIFPLLRIFFDWDRASRSKQRC